MLPDMRDARAGDFLRPARITLDAPARIGQDCLIPRQREIECERAIDGILRGGHHGHRAAAALGDLDLRVQPAA